MNKFKMNNNRQPGNSPGKYVDEENSLNVANLSGNQMNNDAGFTAGGPNAPGASFARNANVTTPTQTTETGFGQARQSNPDGGGDGGEASERGAVDIERGEKTASQKQTALSKRMALKNRKFKSERINKISKNFSTSKKFNTSPRSMAIQQKSIRGNSDAVNTSANTNKLS